MSQAKSSVFAPDLSTSVINFQSIKDQAKQSLIDILDSSNTPQALIVDPALLNPLSFIISVKQMYEHQVQEVLLLNDDVDEQTGLPREKRYQSHHTLFLLRSNSPELIIKVKDIIISHRKHITQQQQILYNKNNAHVMKKPTFSIYFVSRRSLICERLLQQYGLLPTPSGDNSDIYIGEYNLDLIPIDGDLLSLELPHSFSKVFIDGDTTVLFTIAYSMIKLQIFFGVIPLVKGVGRAAHRVAELMHRVSCELLTTSRLHRVDFGGGISSAENAGSPAASQPYLRSSSEQASYSDITSLVYGHINQTNNSITGVISLNEVSRNFSSSANNANVGGMVNTTNSQQFNTVPQAEHQMQLLTQQQTQQQQKSSLSAQLSSLTSSFLGGTATPQPTNPNLQTSQPQAGVNTANSTITAPQPFDLDNPLKPKVNVNYSANPIINNYTIPQITQVVFIDRLSDLISPMLLQRTYEGLLDEMIGINSQSIEYEPASKDTTPDSAGGADGSPTASKKTAKLSVNNADVVYNEFRDVNIKVLGQLFSEKWANIKRTYAETEESMGVGGNVNNQQPIKVTEMERLVKKFKHVHIEHQLLPTHWHLAQKIKDFFSNRLINQYKKLEEEIFVEHSGPAALERWLDESIMKSTMPLDKILRVMVLFAALFGTINRKKTDYYIREILLTYGYEQFPLLINLQHLGVLYNTIPLSDDISSQQNMINNLIMSSGLSKGSTPQQQQQVAQQSIQLAQGTLSQPQNQQSINNPLNLHCSVPKTGYSPFSPLIRKPLWEKLSQRLKLVQTEQQLITIQQQIFTRQQTNDKNFGNPTEKKVANIQTLLRDPFDAYYAYGNFYTPLSIRFIEMAAQSHGLKRLEDALQIQSLLFTPQVSMQQGGTAPGGVTGSAGSSLSAALINASSGATQNTVSSIVNVHSIPLNSDATGQSGTASFLSSLTTTALGTATPQPLTTQLGIQSQLVPSSTSPDTPTLLNPAGIMVSGMDNITNTSNATMVSPGLFEYRQIIPPALQQRMSIPDPHFFGYPLLSTTTVPMTSQQIHQQNLADKGTSVFMVESVKKDEKKNPLNPNQPQNSETQANPDMITNEEKNEDEHDEKRQKPVCLVYFIGGATHAEVAMLRFLSEKPTHKYTYVVATTKMTNAQHIINDLQFTASQMGRQYSPQQ